MANIVSLDQLDEFGCRVEIDFGVLLIFDIQHKLLARVR